MAQERAVAVPTPQERFAQLNQQLAAFPKKDFNWLIPTAAQEISSFFRPVVTVVTIDPTSDDVYEPAGRGKLALHAHALQRVSNALGITWESPRITKQGRWTWVVEIAGWWAHPNGERVRQPGAYSLDMEDDGVIAKRTKAKIGKNGFTQGDAERDIDSYRQFGQQRAVTGAQSIVIRKAVAMKATYTRDELAKPFVCVMFRPDENVPEIRAALAARVKDRDTQVFGQSAGIEVGEVRELEPVRSSEAQEIAAAEAVEVSPATPPVEPPIVKPEPEAPTQGSHEHAGPPAPTKEQLVGFYAARLDKWRQGLTSTNGAAWSTAARTKAASERQVGMVAGMIQKALNLSDDEAKTARRAVLAALWGSFNDYAELNSDQVSATIDWAKQFPKEVAELYSALRP